MATCENPECSNDVEVIPGHRKRRYCCDSCKQTAWRRKHGIAPRLVSTEMDELVQRLAALKRSWPGFDFATYYLLEKIQRKYGEALTTEIADRIYWEIQTNRNNRQSTENE